MELSEIAVKAKKAERGSDADFQSLFYNEIEPAARRFYKDHQWQETFSADETEELDTLFRLLRQACRRRYRKLQLWISAWAPYAILLPLAFRTTSRQIDTSFPVEEVTHLRICSSRKPH